MSTILTNHSKIAKEIYDALRLKHCRRLDFHMGVDEVATVTVEFFPEIDGVKQFPAILKKYKLIPIKGNPVDVTEIGDENVIYQEVT